jgi:hypothetical protein
MESHTPRSLIAGRIVAARGRDLDAATAAAAAILGTDQLAVIHSRVKGDIWYLAAPAVDLASHPNSASPLAAALPGMAQHEGDGAYTLDLGPGLQAVVVKKGPALHSFVGSAALVSRFIELEDVKAVHACNGAGKPWLTSAGLAARREALLNTAVTASGLVVAIIAAMAWLFAARGANQVEGLRADLHAGHIAAWTTALRSVESPAYPPALANLNRAVEQSIKERGSLVQFEHKDGRATWTLNVNSRIVAGGAN